MNDILTRSVWTRANHRCEYCHMPAAQYAGFFHVDHILARQHGGGWIGSARRDCFDHVIALNEAHVRRLGREFIAYYHED